MNNEVKCKERIKGYPETDPLIQNIKESEADWIKLKIKMSKLLVILQLVLGRAYHHVLVQSGHKVRLPIKVERWLMCRFATAPCTIKASKQR